MRKTDLPPASLAARAFAPIDYADAYEVELAPDAPRDVDAFARRVLTSPPRWVDALMGARDAAVGLFGLKTRPDGGKLSLPERFEPGARAGLFKVYARADDEILFGEDDKHLDFRVSLLLLRQAADQARLFGVMSTVVRFHNRLGRAYFLPVKPVHRVIVRAMLARASRLDRSTRQFV